MSSVAIAEALLAVELVQDELLLNTTRIGPCGPVQLFVILAEVELLLAMIVEGF
jgi:hypothetical protein